MAHEIIKLRRELSFKKITNIVILALIVAAIPVTVFVAQYRQEIRSRAFGAFLAFEAEEADVISFPAAIGLDSAASEGKYVQFGGTEQSPIRIIDTSLWSPPSPDPSGIAYFPSDGTLYIVDGEVEEISKLFAGKNVYKASRTGDLLSAYSVTSFSNEPTDVAINSVNNHIFFSDDVKRMVFEVNVGADGVLGTNDDTRTSFSTSAFGSNDPEGLAFGNNILFISDGEGNKVYKVSPGANGIFDGVDDKVTNFSVSGLGGINDPEGVEFNPDKGTLYILGRNKILIETSVDGSLIQKIDISSLSPIAPAGVAYGPSSIDPLTKSLYIVDRGVDNNANPNENDGKLYELVLGLSNDPLPTSIAIPTSSSFTVPPSADYLPAFPGAEGFGTKSTGGRGGKVMLVTNLNDSGTGSLRACTEATGPRTCVFRTGGTIALSSALKIKNPYITIAGQTASGGGITLKGGSGAALSIDGAHDVIIRYLRIRPGPGGDKDGLQFLQGYNIIVDHVSASWATDENVGFTTNTATRRDITIQWSIISEGLNNSTHSEGAHSKGILIGDNTKQLSLHHNLFAHNLDRNPLFKGGTTGEVINNLIYNWGRTSGATHLNDSNSTGISFANIIGNHYIPGTNSPSDKKPINIATTINSSTKIYVKDNIGPGRASNSGDDWLIVDDYNTSNDLNSSHRVNSFAISPSGIKTTAIELVKDLVLQKAGALFPVRDTVDERIINEVKSGTGKIIDDPSQVGGWPTINSGAPYTDTDNDGMPDNWEGSYGLNPNLNDSAQDKDGNGYTNIEEYINSLVI